MSEQVAVIGLGNMGYALAARLIDTGHPVTVWNRTASKAAALVAAGATQARSSAEAVARCGLVIVCVGNYQDSHAVLQDCTNLSGRTLIQLTTGTAADGAALQALVVDRGGDYLDGVILAFPSGIGKSETMIAVAGSESAWSRGEPVLRTLGGASLYLGTNLAAPAALDAAIIGPTLLATLGAIQGAHLLRRAGVDVGVYAESLQRASNLLTASLVRQVRAIADDRFEHPEAALETWAAAIEHDADPSGDAEFDLYAPVRALLRRAVAEGHGRLELAAVVKVLD